MNDSHISITLLKIIKQMIWLQNIPGISGLSERYLRKAPVKICENYAVCAFARKNCQPQ